MGRLPVEFHPAAPWDVREARLWYEAQSPQAATQFIVEWQRALAHIEEAPQRWPKHIFGTRRLRLHRYPYYIIYRILDNCIEVVACHHAKRHRQPWRDRLR